MYWEEEAYQVPVGQICGRGRPKGSKGGQGLIRDDSVVGQIDADFNDDGDDDDDEEEAEEENQEENEEEDDEEDKAEDDNDEEAQVEEVGAMEIEEEEVNDKKVTKNDIPTTQASTSHAINRVLRTRKSVKYF